MIYSHQHERSDQCKQILTANMEDKNPIKKDFHFFAALRK